MIRFGALALDRSKSRGDVPRDDRTRELEPTMSEKRSGLAVGMTLFAATMLIVIGFLQAMQGLVALLNDNFYVAGQKWVFEFDVTTWGWIHLLLGIVVALAGF